MSIKLMGQVWDTAPVEGSALLVLLALADYANDKDICWPSLPTLATRARISERQTQRVIQKLEDDGHIEVLERGDGRGHSTKYKITIKGDIQGKGDIATSTLPEIKVDVAMSPNENIKGDNLTTFNGERVTSETERVTSSALKGDIAMSTDPYEPPILNHQLETEEGIAGATPAPSLANWPEFLEAFCWICHGHSDLSALTEKQKGILTSEAKRVCAAGYSLDDLRTWFRDKWQKDWRWTKEKKHERPAPSDVRSMIPAIRDEETLQSNGDGYQVDLPGVVHLRPPAQPATPRPISPPMAHEDPWAICLKELSIELASGFVPTLEGSRIEEAGMVYREDGKLVPHYVVLIAPERAANGLNHFIRQAGVSIRKKLGSVLGYPVLIDIVDAADYAADVDPFLHRAASQEATP